MSSRTRQDVVRAVPVILYRNDLPKPEQLPFGSFASVTSLGLVVVITHIGLTAKILSPDIVRALT